MFHISIEKADSILEDAFRIHSFIFDTEKAIRLEQMRIKAKRIMDLQWD